MISVFDIETEPLPDDQLAKLLPEFDESKYPLLGQFDPKSVRYGNVKDEEKRAAKLEDERVKHEAAREAASEARKAAKENHFTDFRAKAALSPVTGRVLVIGMCAEDGRCSVIHEETELRMLQQFWATFRAHEVARRQDGRSILAGVNIFSFDLPFLVKRSWILQVAVPKSVVDLTSRWANWSPVFVDLRRVWQLGDSQASSSFDLIGRAIGTGGKVEGHRGQEFGELWRTDRDRALQYLANDVRQPMEWLQRFGLGTPQEWEKFE